MILTIPGNPIPQARPRLFSRYGKSMVFDPNSSDKKMVRATLEELKSAEEDFQEFKCPEISFAFYFHPAKCTKTDETWYKSELVRHLKKPDVDNLAKFYMDCMDGIFYNGDQKVSLGVCLKIYSYQPRTVIMLKEQDPVLDSPVCFDTSLSAEQSL